MRSIRFGLLLVVLLFAAQLRAETVSVIPWVTETAQVVVMNPGLAQEVHFAGTGGGSFTAVIGTRATIRFVAGIRGNIRITSAAPVTAWSVVDGCTILADAPRNAGRVVASSGLTGIAIANPGREQATIWFSVYDASGRWILDETAAMSPDVTFSFMLPLMFPQLRQDAGYTIEIRSNKDISLAAVESRQGVFHAIPVGESR